MKIKKMYRVFWMSLAVVLLVSSIPASIFASSAGGDEQVISVSDNAAKAVGVSENEIPEYPSAGKLDLFAIDPEKMELLINNLTKQVKVSLANGEQKVTIHAKWSINIVMQAIIFIV